MITDDVFTWARLTPDKIAAVYNGETVSYRTFARLIALARGFFARRGCVGPGVALIRGSNVFEFWIWSLALRSLGLTTMAVPSVAEVSGPLPEDVRFVVTTPVDATVDFLAACEARGLELVNASLEGEAPLGLDAGAPAFPPGGHVLLTSGTTGTYKRVLFEPRFEPEFMRIRRQAGAYDRDTVFLVFAFGAWTGIGYKTPVATWMVGGTIVFDQRADLHRALLYPGITHASVVPIMLDAILAAPPGSFPRANGLQLHVNSGTVTQSQIDQAKARISPRVYNGLGATEVNSFGITALDGPEDHRWHTPVPEVEVQVVDELGRPVPAGRMGRVRVTTANGPTGYLDDEDATRAFFADGFFYPGDLGIIRADGRLALRGRVTDVININGRKISPAPIEDRLRENLAVSGVCLFSMQDDAGDEEIHVVIESGPTIPIDRVGEMLRREIQGGQILARVHYANSLPRNAMGKVLRQAAREQALRRAGKLSPV